MKINWLSSKEAVSSEVQKLIDTEYKFRSKVTLMLLENFKDKDWFDLENIEFDFHTDESVFLISENTPEPAYSFLSNMSLDSCI